jgi:hypothetical protein
MTGKMQNAAFRRRVLRCSKGPKNTLLTGNGLWAAFSVLVHLAYKGFGTALLTHVPHDVSGRINA